MRRGASRDDSLIVDDMQDRFLDTLFVLAIIGMGLMAVGVLYGLFRLGSFIVGLF